MDCVRQCPREQLVKFELLNYVLERHTVQVGQQPPQGQGELFSH
jgi:hypothetical protein